MKLRHARLSFRVPSSNRVPAVESPAREMRASRILQVLLVFTLWFFRDPERQAPSDPDAIVSPADGRVIRVDEGRVSVFLNVFNVHVCRAPVAGKVTSIVHTPRRFMAAFKDAASEHNERTAIDIASEPHTVRLTLVAGLIARRIVSWIDDGDELEVGQRVGLIRFGSRADVDLPPGAATCVAIGDKVVAGETILARLPDRAA